MHCVTWTEAKLAINVLKAVLGEHTESWLWMFRDLILGN